MTNAVADTRSTTTDTNTDITMRTVLPSDVVQEGSHAGNSQPIISLFEAENYAKTDGANINELYDKMKQSDYEQFLVHVNYTEPYYVCDTILNSVDDGGLGFDTTNKNKKDSKDNDINISILDFGCGTGIVGHLIKDAGYTNIWGLDASEKFVEMINTNGIYKGAEVMFLGRGPNTFPTKYHNKYDLVTGTGVFLAKHIPSEAFYDAHQALKVGGIFCFTLRSNLWVTGHELGYKDVIDKLVAEKKFEYIHSATKTFWRGKEEGTGLFARQQSKLFALRKIN